jgi:hypothetical protein
MILCIVLFVSANSRWTGIATHYVPTERLEALESRLAEVGSHDFAKIDATIQEFENGPPKGYHFSITPEILTAIDRYPIILDLISEYLHSTIYRASSEI